MCRDLASHLSTSSPRSQGGNAQKKAALGTVSLVDVEAPNHARFPLFKDAKYTEAIIGPGDAVRAPGSSTLLIYSLSLTFDAPPLCTSCFALIERDEPGLSFVGW